LTWSETDEISSDEQYLNSLKSFVKAELRKQAEEHVVQNKDGYFEIEMEVLASDNAFNLGELYDFNLNLEKFPKKPMRVVEIQYTNTIDVIRFKEDEPSV
jgi:hypothetical protein